MTPCQLWASIHVVTEGFRGDFSRPSRLRDESPLRGDPNMLYPSLDVLGGVFVRGGVFSRGEFESVRGVDQPDRPGVGVRYFLGNAFISNTILDWWF